MMVLIDGGGLDENLLRPVALVHVDEAAESSQGLTELTTVSSVPRPSSDVLQSLAVSGYTELWLFNPYQWRLPNVDR